MITRSPSRARYHVDKKPTADSSRLVFCHRNSDLDRLVLDWLIIEGYRDAAVSFAAELEAEDTQHHSMAEAPEARPARWSSKIDFDSIHERMLIREAVEAGRVDEAVRRVNELDSEVSILFHKPSIPASIEIFGQAFAYSITQRGLPSQQANVPDD